jgi:hypothetical protein
MDRNLVLLNQNIARLRRDVRLQTWEIVQLIAADIDCTSAAQRLMRMLICRLKASTCFMLSIGRISPAAACCSPSSIIVRVVPALALRSPCDPMRYTPLRFANRENVGRVDHPEHHAQARPKWNGGYKFIVRLGATANKKERSCPRFLIVEFFGVRGDAKIG